MSTREAEAGPISRPLGAAAIGLVVAVATVAAVRAASPRGTMLAVAVVLVLSIPMWVVASMLSAVVTVDGNGLRRRGWLRTIELEWSGVRRISTWKGLFGLTGLAVRGRRRKVTLSSAMPGFEAAAVVILAEATERGIPVRTPWA